METFGNKVWSSAGPQAPRRESLGLSVDGSLSVETELQDRVPQWELLNILSIMCIVFVFCLKHGNTMGKSKSSLKSLVTNLHQVSSL